MGRPKKELRTIDVAVFAIDVKMDSGNIFSMELASRLMNEVNAGKRYTIEEVSPVERQLKKKLPYVSWPEHAMAESVAARIENDRLIMTFVIKPNRFGKLLETTLDTSLTHSIRFFPVGYGDTDENGVIKMDYALGYVAFEVVA